MNKNLLDRMVDRLMTPDELAELVPSRRKGRRTSAQTIRRWMFEGLKGRFLRFTRVGSIPCSTESALMEFFEELTLDDENRRFHHISDELAHQKPALADQDKIRSEFYNNRAKELGL